MNNISINNSLYFNSIFTKLFKSKNNFNEKVNSQSEINLLESEMLKYKNLAESNMELYNDLIDAAKKANWKDIYHYETNSFLETITDSIYCVPLNLRQFDKEGNLLREFKFIGAGMDNGKNAYCVQDYDEEGNPYVARFFYQKLDSFIPNATLDNMHNAKKIFDNIDGTSENAVCIIDGKKELLFL